MAEGVVDLLEAVEIHHQDRAAILGPASGAKGLIDPVAKQGAVGEPGERVVQRLVLVELSLGHERRLGGLLLGDVLDHDDAEVRLPG